MYCVQYFALSLRRCSHRRSDFTGTSLDTSDIEYDIIPYIVYDIVPYIVPDISDCPFPRAISVEQAIDLR